MVGAHANVLIKWTKFRWLVSYYKHRNTRFKIEWKALCIDETLKYFYQVFGQFTKLLGYFISLYRSSVHVIGWVPYSVKFWWDKTLANCLFKSFAERNVGESKLATLVNMEFGWIKYWQMALATHQNFNQYCIAGKFGGEKVWRIWRIIRDSPN